MGTEIPKRRLGRTGLMVAELGLGAMDTPTSPERFETVMAAAEHGIEFFDTARDYAGSEFLLGELVRARGAEGLHIGSKTFSRTIDGSQWDVDRSLRAIGVPSLALYQLHDVSAMDAWRQVMQEGGALEGLKVAQYRGLIRHIGISTHDLEVAREAIVSGEFDTIMLEYSAFYTESAPLIDLAAEHEVAVIVMRPLGGSGRTSSMRTRMAEGYDGPLTPANLLRYVLANPGVSVAIPGARYPSRIHDNVATVTGSPPMDEADRRELEQLAAELY